MLIPGLCALASTSWPRSTAPLSGEGPARARVLTVESGSHRSVLEPGGFTRSPNTMWRVLRFPRPGSGAGAAPSAR